MAERNDKTVATLAKQKLFKGLDRAAVEKLLSSTDAKVKQFERGEVVLHQGDRVRSLAIVLSGRLNVIQATRDGSEVIDYTVKAGGVVGVSYVLQRSEPFPSRLEAAESSEVAFLDIGKLREAIKTSSYAGLRENLVRALVGLVSECQKKLSVVGCWEIGDKVMTYLEGLAAETGKREVEIPFRTSAEFAQYIGVNRCALSRSLSQLARKGVISHEGGTFYLP
jgi:CRP-like cAMP-binding protein